MFVLSLTLLGCAPVTSQSGNDTQVVLVSDVQWQQLNPLRGDKSPKAANLWGKGTEAGPAGFLVQFVDGFSSPPHIHNVAYRGVVISGLLHNDDPKARAMWMPKCSFWTQPAGEVHITAAKGKKNIAYIEVEDSFGVLPANKAFDDGERPVNIHRTNIVWISHKSFLWGKPQKRELNGTLVKLSAGYTGKIHNQGRKFRTVVVQGRVKLRHFTDKSLAPGSYFGSEGKSVHRVSCDAGVDCIVYVRAMGTYKIHQHN